MKIYVNTHICNSNNHLCVTMHKIFLQNVAQTDLKKIFIQKSVQKTVIHKS